jgi:polyphosphate kinase
MSQGSKLDGEEQVGAEGLAPRGAEEEMTAALPLDALVDLNAPTLYINRELSIVEFHRRVLAQAQDRVMPLLERVRFLAIFSTLLDEFYEIRVAGLKQEAALGTRPRSPDGLEPGEVLRRISVELHAMVDEQYRLLNEDLLPGIAAEGMRLLRRSEWNDAQRRWIQDYFAREVLPLLTPVGLDPAHPFPTVQNKGLCFVVTLRGSDAYGRDSGVAIVQVPRVLPRLIRLPAELAAGPYEFVMISAVVHHGIHNLFPGMQVLDCHQFRVTRNSNLWVDEEEIDDLLRALKTELPRRPYGQAVRLEVTAGLGEELTQFLLAQFKLDAQHLYRVRGPVNLHRIAALYDMVDRPDLKFSPLVQDVPEEVGPKVDLFSALAQGDVLLHHPYQSFQPVLQLLRQAAADPAVLAIKQTLYRTGAESPVVDALIEAARSGKDVTAIVELRARFDEAANIRLATRLQEAGANVVYGIVGYKAHCKMLMVVRRDGDRLRRYVHLGTGNYHLGTSRAYTDLSLLTARDDLGEDIHLLFNQLTGLGQAAGLRRVLQAPFTLHSELLRMIGEEAEEARAGRPSGIQAKMNALTEPEVVRALYAASQAGVPIDLVVRGACRLRPGVAGVSDHIRVRSVVGRFLEHARVYCFYARGQQRVFCSSADWMSRNLLHRVETCFPIDDPRLKIRVREETIELYLRSDAQAWLLGPDGRYTLAGCSDHRPAAQLVLAEELGG